MRTWKLLLKWNDVFCIWIDQNMLFHDLIKKKREVVHNNIVIGMHGWTISSSPHRQLLPEFWLEFGLSLLPLCLLKMTNNTSFISLVCVLYSEPKYKCFSPLKPQKWIWVERSEDRLNQKVGEVKKKKGKEKENEEKKERIF